MFDFVLQRYGTFFDYPKSLNDHSDFFRFFFIFFYYLCKDFAVFYDFV